MFWNMKREKIGQMCVVTYNGIKLIGVIINAAKITYAPAFSGVDTETGKHYFFNSEFLDEFCDHKRISM